LREGVAASPDGAGRGTAEERGCGVSEQVSWFEVRGPDGNLLQTAEDVMAVELSKGGHFSVNIRTDGEPLPEAEVQRLGELLTALRTFDNAGGSDWQNFDPSAL
jgi:hypothetical protein